MEQTRKRQLEERVRHEADLNRKLLEKLKVDFTRSIPNYYIELTGIFSGVRERHEILWNPRQRVFFWRTVHRNGRCT
jgi:hypothetical protein